MLKDLMDKKVDRIAYVWRAKDRLFKILIVDTNGLLRNVLIKSQNQKDLESILYLLQIPFIPQVPSKRYFKDCIKLTIDDQLKIVNMDELIKKVKQEIDEALEKRDYEKAEKLRKRLEYYKAENC